MKKTSQNQKLSTVSRNESVVRKKLDKGWNCFTREEVELLLDSVEFARMGKRNYQRRLHAAHGDAVAWHYEGSIGFHETRPAPVGAINLFEKPKTLPYEPGWRLQRGARIPGYSVDAEGKLKPTRSNATRPPMSPNDVMRHLHSTLASIHSGYKNMRKQDEELIEDSHPDHRESVGEPDTGTGLGGSPVGVADSDQLPGACGEDLQSDGSTL